MTAPMQVEIYSDTICPWCYIGKRRFEKALSRVDLAVNVTWMPYQLNPGMPHEGMDRQDYLAQKFGGAARAEQVYQPVRQAGEMEGIDFAFDAMRRTPNTLDSHRLIHFAKQAGLQDALVQALFTAYFERAEDIGDIKTLSEIAQSAGLDEAEVESYLQSGADREQVRRQDEMARQMGIQGVPFFVVARRYAVSGAQSPEMFLKVFDTLAAQTADDRDAQ